MNIETKKQIAIGKYNDTIQQLSAVENAWKNLRKLQNNFCDVENNHFVCLDPETYEKITDEIEKIENELAKLYKMLRDEKIDAECVLAVL